MSSLLKLHLGTSVWRCVWEERDQKGVCEGTAHGFLSTPSFPTCTGDVLILTPDHWELLCFLFLLFLMPFRFILPFSCSSIFVCLLADWLSDLSAVLRRLWQQSGSQAVTQQLRGPPVFLKSGSINIIIACSRHHWIFYCNVQQNVPPHRGSVTAWQKLHFDWKLFVSSASSVQVFVFLLCFRFVL